MQSLGVYSIACMTSAALAGICCNTNFRYSRLEICDAARCKRASVSVGKVCNTNAPKFRAGGVFHCDSDPVTGYPIVLDPKTGQPVISAPVKRPKLNEPNGFELAVCFVLFAVFVTVFAYCVYKQRLADEERFRKMEEKELLEKRTSPKKC
ncbi:unnamed protein product [Amoebophrya sp. A120]|nr:unnamed protein product [Amoebophrya sp. A120]|eukprot:GSA120T00009239001.1